MNKKITKHKLALIEMELDLDLEIIKPTRNPIYNSFESEIYNDLTQNVKHNKVSIEKLARSYGINNKNNAKELTELAIVNVAREIIKTSDYPYEQLVDLYNSQPNLSHRTSNSIILNQYSTPAPIAYLAGLYVKKSQLGEQYFEPTAGNGLLTIALPQQLTVVNELDSFRYKNLEKQNFKATYNEDVIGLSERWYQANLHENKKYYSEKEYKVINEFTGIIANPPFSTLEQSLTIDGFVIKKLEHLIAIMALKLMLPFGRASIIVGGHTEYEDAPRGAEKQIYVRKGTDRYFLNYLYHHYNVDDVINIDGHQLYSRQGTAINTRLILINGRKKIPNGFAIKSHPELSDVVTDFYQLEKRVMKHINSNQI